jgi:eukaryotic-like serine/threonine-protein kinase
MTEHANGDVLPSDPRERLARGDQISEDGLIDLLCSDQVNRWRAGERIPAEAYLALHPTLGGGEAAFELVYGEYLVRELLGEAPKLDEFLWRFPRFAERLRRQLNLHHALAADETAGEPDLPGETPAADKETSSTAPDLPGYHLEGELGRGGMSVVYLARQVALNRLVALKVIRARIYADAAIAARFRDEAEAAARFQHPNIVQVYEVGEFEGLGYLVLEYVAGGSLEQKLAGTPQPPRESAHTIEDLARALHYAHQRGIIHRDLKPANVVLTADGLPKVTDFGLAKLLERDGGLTQTGDIIGTPSYMAPEQAQGTPSDATPATDVYALGAILYEMLTGRPPFKGATPLSTLSQVAGHEPVAPGKLQRHTPRVLETICLKCLEKEPRKRYVSALDLADDLRRFLENRPIQARRISIPELCWRWCRREPVKAGLVAALVCAFCAGVAGVAIQWRRAEDKARAESLARARAEQEQRRALDNLYFSRIAQARLEWRLNNVGRMKQLLDNCDPARRGWEWHYLRNISQSELLTVSVPDCTYIASVVFSPDGERFAFAAYNPYNNDHESRLSRVEVWDTTSQQRLHAFVGPLDTMRLSFRPDGRLLAATGIREAKIWDTTTGQLVRTWPPGGTVTYSPDGRFLAAGNSKEAAFWDAATGKEVRRLATGMGRVTFSPDSQVLAVSGRDAVNLHDMKTGRQIRALPHGVGEPEARSARFYPEEGPDLAFSRDGRLLVVATRTPRVWDTTTGQLLHQLSGHTGAVSGVAFSPDGRRVATAGVDSTIRLWDVASGAERALLRGHTAWIGDVAFHPEGWSLLSGGRHYAEVKLWDLTRPQEFISLPHASTPSFVFDDGGRRLKMVTDLGRLKTREIETGSTTVGSLVDLYRQWVTPAAIAEFSGDGLRLATVAANRLLVKVWDPNSGNQITTLTGLSAPATYLAVARDGGRVAAAGLYAKNLVRTREVKVWSTAAAQLLASFTPSRAASPYTHGRVALSPDGQWVAFDDYDPSPAEPSDSSTALPPAWIKVCEVASGRELLSLPVGNSIVFCLTFSPDGKVLAVGNQDAELFVWDIPTGELRRKQKQSEFYFRLAFSPDGQRLAGVDREKVQMWNASDGQEILLLQATEPRAGDGGFNPWLVWSQDGRQLASFNWNGSVSVWSSAAESRSSADRRRNEAEGRVFDWHLAEAESAVDHGQSTAAVFHLSRLTSTAPPDVTSLTRRARLCLHLGQWERARNDFARWYEGGEADEGPAWLGYARLLVSLGDSDGYRKVCTRMLEVFEQGPHRTMADAMAYAFALAPGSSREAGRAIKMAEKELARYRLDADRQFSLALTHFRAEEYETAGASLRKLINADVSWAWRSWPVLAMIEHRLGHGEEARRELDRALEWRDQHTAAEDLSSTNSIVSEVWLDFRAHCREAASLLDQMTR